MDTEEKLGLADVIVWRTLDGLTTITTCDGPHRVAGIYCGTVRWHGFSRDQCKPDLLEWIDKQVNEYNKKEEANAYIPSWKR